MQHPFFQLCIQLGNQLLLKKFVVRKTVLAIRFCGKNWQSIMYYFLYNTNQLFVINVNKIHPIGLFPVLNVQGCVRKGLEFFVILPDELESWNLVCDFFDNWSWWERWKIQFSSCVSSCETNCLLKKLVFRKTDLAIRFYGKNWQRIMYDSLHNTTFFVINVWKIHPIGLFPA